MTFLEELNALVESANIPVETGVFSGVAPSAYVVITPIYERFALHGDNAPGVNIEEARLCLFDKGNYNEKKWRLVALLLAADFAITDRRYIEHADEYEDNAGYHQYAIDVAKAYEMEEE
jgi:hypothetical protein